MVITIIMKSLCKEDHGCEVLSNLWSLSLWLEKQHQSSIVKQLRMGSFSANSNFNCHVSKCFIFSVIPRIDDIGQLSVVLFIISRLWRRCEEVLCTPSHAQMVFYQPFLLQGGGMGNGES